MQSFLFSLGVLWLTIVSLQAQISVEILLDQEQYLRDESLPVKVRITNRSGKPLNLGREADWLSFAVETRDGKTITQISEMPVKEEFTLQSSMVGTRRVNLTPHFNLAGDGQYNVTATIRIPDWNQELVTKPKKFEIVRGTPLWDQAIGVPAGDNAAPEVRKYILQQAHLKRLTLYVRITDESETVTHRLLPVGPLVSFSRPEPQVDKDSNLHLLFQTGARSFSYSVVSPKGDLVLRQTHDYTRTRPVLRSKEDGRIYVAGGQRRFATDDLPPLTIDNPTNNVSAVTP
jgi:hypothetical protein